MSVFVIMNVIVLKGYGGFDKLVWQEDWLILQLGVGEVLIKVGVCGLNNIDVNMWFGWYFKMVLEVIIGSVYVEVVEDDLIWGGWLIIFFCIQGVDMVGMVVVVGMGVDLVFFGKWVMVDCWL